VGELIFQMSYYGILVAQRIFMAIMLIFCPIMFALSLAPPWSSAWSQWMSKFLSLSLWGFVTYMCLYYIDFILLYNLQQDLIAYDHLLHGSLNSWSQIGALGLQGIGSNCMYAMGMLVGAYIIRFVPEVASWLIPGGVSSGAGSAAGATAVGITATAGAVAGNTVTGGAKAVMP
jgi:phosphoglycerol transferase MdoB-like AlkP superfamily enzyme